ncbi:MAG: thiamine phosphate synthase, partial [Rubrobacteraceae bacterium]
MHLVTDQESAQGDLHGVIEAALRGGVDWVQLREKTGPALGLYEMTRMLLPEARKAGAGLLVNDRIDVALAADADGVHLAARSLPPGVARELLGKRVIGVSVHGLEEAREAADAGADYVTFGHVYPTSSKPGLPPRGIRGLAEIVESVDVPVVAIGGIDASNMPEVLGTGCAGVAVISAIMAAGSPELEARALRRAVDGSRHYPRHPLPEPKQRGA